MAKVVPLLTSPFFRPFPDVELEVRKVPGGFASVQEFIKIWNRYGYAGMIVAIEECAYEIRTSLPEFSSPSKQEAAMRGVNMLLSFIEDPKGLARLRALGFEIDEEVLDNLVIYETEGPIDTIKGSASFKKILKNCKSLVSRYGVEMFYYVIYVANSLVSLQALPAPLDEAMIAGAVAYLLDGLWQRYLREGSGGAAPPPGAVLH